MDPNVLRNVMAMQLADGQPPTITNRGMLVPRVEYSDGSQGWGVPGLLMEPWQAMQRLQAGASDEVGRMTSGQPFSKEAIADALTVGGSAAMGSVAAPKPAGAYVTSGAPMQKAQQGFRAYHGSPHDFDRFDISKIGTGEGAQAYGPGLYFAEAEDVARSYRDNLSRFRDMEWDGSRISDDPRAYNAFRDAMETPESWRIGKIVDFVAARGGAHDDVMREARHYFDDRKPEWKAAFDEVDSRLKTSWKPGRMYEVNINADPNDFIDWDAPWSANPKAVAFAESHGLKPHADTGAALAGATDMKFAGYPASVAGREKELQALREAGIPGIKYLDQGSRSAGEGSRNYVVFDDKLIDIVRKYGIAGAASLYGVSHVDIANTLQEQ